MQRSVGDSVRLYGLSRAYVDGERYHLALRVMRRNFAALATSGHPSIPRAFWELLYPWPWRGEVTDAAERMGLDPCLVAAVVREESSYYPRAVSRAGARGLMQLMPATAQPMVAGRGWSFRGGDLLDEPAANIELGTSFLAQLCASSPMPGWRSRRTTPVHAGYVSGGRHAGTTMSRPGSRRFRSTRRATTSSASMLSWEEYRRIYDAR